MAQGIECMLRALKNASSASTFGLLTRPEMEAFLRSQNMSDQDLFDLQKDLGKLYKAAANRVTNRRNENTPDLTPYEKRQLAVAKQRLAAGDPMNEINDDTKWFRDASGVWRNGSMKEQAMVDIFYSAGTPVINLKLTPDNRLQFEQFANAFGIPFLTQNQLDVLDDLAQKSDERKGQEKAVIDDQIRFLLDQNDEQYFTRLQSAKVAFKVLLSAGFNIMSSISNRKKYWEELLQFRLRMAVKGKDGTAIGRFFQPYPLAQWQDVTKMQAKQLARAVRGAEGEGLRKFFTGLGWTDNQVLHGPSSVYGADVSASADALEYGNLREYRFDKGIYKGLLGGLRRADRKIARMSKRWAASVDAAGKVRIGELHYFSERFDQQKKKNPTLTDQQIIKLVTDEMYAVDRPTAEAQAEQEFLQWGVEVQNVNGVPTVNKRSARYQVRVAEIIKEGGRIEAVSHHAYNRASVALWQGRTTMIGSGATFQEKVDSGVGGLIADAINAGRNVCERLIMQSPLSTTAKGQAQNLVFSMFGFINGPAAYFEDFLEHNLVYAAMKYTVLDRMKAAGQKDFSLSKEELEIIEDKKLEMAGKFMFSTVELAAAITVMFLAKELCPGDLETGFTGNKPEGKTEGKLSLTQQQKGENTINGCGISVPVEWLGGFSLGNARFIGAMYDAMKNKSQSWGEGLATALAATGEGGMLSVFSQGHEGVISKMFKEYDKRGTEEGAMERFYGAATTLLSRGAAQIAVQMLPIPQRLLKEPVQAVLVPYRTYSDVGEPGSVEQVLDFTSQFGNQLGHIFLNTSNINQLAQLSTRTDGKIGRPLFDYRGRLIDAGNMYDGKSIAGFTLPFRQAWEKVQGKDPILYDELDHHLVMNKVALSWDSRTKVAIFKDDDEKKRILTDDEYYAYHYAQSRLLGEWLQEEWDSGGLKERDVKELRKDVVRQQSDIRAAIRAELEYISDSGEKIKPEEFPQLIYNRLTSRPQ